MSEMTQEEALGQADALVGQALRETEARCAVLGQYINHCDRQGSKTAACCRPQSSSGSTSSPGPRPAWYPP